MKRIFTISALLLLSAAAYAQKKPLDHSVYDGWETVGASSVSPKGNVVMYEVNPQEGDGRLVIRTFGKKGFETVIERGYRGTVLDNENAAVCLIKPRFADSRKAKIDKLKDDKAPKDSLAVIDLRTGSVTKFADVHGYSLGKYSADAVAFATSDTCVVTKDERGKKDSGRPVLLYYFQDGRTDTLRHVDSYGFDKSGKTLAFVTKRGKRSTGVGFYDVVGHASVMLPDTSVFHSQPVFDENGTSALFLPAADTLDSGSKHCALYRYDIGSADASCLVEAYYSDGLPEKWGLTENSRPYFSHDGKRIFVGIQPYQEPKDTSLVPFETAGLDIWNWNAPELPPMTKKNLQRDLRSTCTAVYSDGGLIPLTLSKFDRISLIDRGDAPYALSVDGSAHVVETQWNTQTEETVSLVDLKDGSRRLVAEGVFSRVSSSPEGKYLIWYDVRSRAWILYDIAAGTERNLTAGLGVTFWDDLDDHPMMPGAYGLAGWSEGDADVFIYDRYDIWKIHAADGTAVNLTAGEGRRTGRQYRYINVKDSDVERAVRAGETVLLNVFDNDTKENGIAFLDVSKAAAPKNAMFGPHSYSGVQKARSASVYTYRKGDFANPMDIYCSTAPGKDEKKLSSINPQQKDYNWGTAELYRWYAYDGTALDGILYKPEDFDESKKYPVMIYFYERNSENLYTYYSPAPSRSIINIPFYVSRGYVVFVPDIVYSSGTPGESAYNCIVSGAESLTAFPWIDRDNMAIQGQSWGGYQVAYLITRTGMFKAAGAGAPVSNMTSAYGGIRWGSGMSRQFQYEQTQSRIGRDLWHGIELYMENSPLFKLPEVTTPVLIMHNDEDGAVPWYQGIEMFMGLRRLGKQAWLLEYNGEDHNLVERRNTKDLSVRLQQFFDHFLKGEPEPAWMKYGIPTARKGQYFGFEPAE